jgi:ribosomal protein L16 Arg81 hydroxylase
MRQGQGNVLYFKHQEQQLYPNPYLAFCCHASVVINRADKFSAELHSLCTSLQNEMPFAYCQVYLTPSNCQTVCAHSDDRDVLLLQVLGKKRWRVYDAPIPLPCVKTSS